MYLYVLFCLVYHVSIVSLNMSAGRLFYTESMHASWQEIVVDQRRGLFLVCCHTLDSLVTSSYTDGFNTISYFILHNIGR